MAEDGADTVDAIPSAPLTPIPVWLQRILLILPLVGILGVVGYNVEFWYRFVQYDSDFNHMDDGQCELNSAEYSTSVLHLKVYWYYPVLGTIGWPKSAWTNVPCYAHVKALDSQGTEVRTGSKKTLLLFTYWQGWAPNFVTDTCHNMIPELAKKGRFDCTFDSSQEYTDSVYVGRREELPNYPLLFGMKAAGLTFCTLAPLVLLACCCYKGHLDRARTRFRVRTDFREAVAREPLCGGQLGTRSDCGSGPSSVDYAPLLEGA